ncbi:ribonuclease R [Bacterioplanes sanyensis]|uniref:Ribonuclease R n=1 Tax=Bacterioplanes sanyensis TaxID=1249553 RepID=A0A222FH33_9GAMM|nr:ribonuclease R [Bacterioplanes sanyensis]ASP38377.1 ribonuclease R [Bacterioplanes sanyensis]
MTDSKNGTFIDPNAASEAEKYENPVASREALLALLESSDRPMSHADVCEALSENDEERIEALRRRLIAMARDGQLISNRRNQFMPMSKANLVQGLVMGHRDGFGFVLRDGEDDVYLSNRQMSKVFHGDRVAVQILGHDRRGRPEGKIVEVLERNTLQVVGRYFDQSGVGVVQPDNKRVSHEVLVPPHARHGAKHGQFVVVQITQQPKPGGLPMGDVVEVLGDHLAPGMEIDVAIRSHNIPSEWPDAVQHETKRLPDKVAEADKKQRIDLRHLPFVTIDGEDAKDFDDAVYCEVNKSTGGWRLYVAIADVSHYVRTGSALDHEAHQRGNSVYFPEFVVPMLPEKLSNGLCSLNPEVDRLVMVCEMTISKNGRLSGYKFMEGIIHSHARLTYNKVWQMLQRPLSEDGKAWRKHYRPIVGHLENLYTLFKLLRQMREQRGAMDFDSVETRIVFDAERKIQQIVPTTRNDAHMLIEECMLAANVCAADFFQRYDLAALYRVHKGPSEEKLENLHAFLGELGLSMPHGKEPSPKDYQALLQQIQTRPDSHLIQTVMLRSLSQAQYDPENEGHFGLAFKAYTHFTSPIRRYPDLLVHRGIRHIIRSDKECRHVRRVDGAKPIAGKHIYPYDLAAMVQLGEHCSMTERRADDATRDVVDFLKCEYIREHIGEEFEGVISAVTGFGLFVELKDVYVEGLVHVSSLQNDFYQFDPVKHRLTGERTRRSFRLGDSVWVRVVAVNLDDRKVDFELTSAPKHKGRQALDMPKPARMPRRRAQGSDQQEELAPGRKPSAAAQGKKSADDKKSKGKKKPSKRQKLNAKKNTDKKSEKKTAKKSKKKSAKKASKK